MSSQNKSLKVRRSKDRDRGCTGKIPFGDRKSARFVAAAMRSGTGGHITEYFCAFCKNWHVGHTPKELR